MEIQRKGAGCHPRQLKNKLNTFISENKLSSLTKRKRVLTWLICASNCGCKVTRFDSEIMGDHCLNTTISEIGRVDGIKVHRTETKRPTQFGKDTPCKEYWLDENGIQAAERLLGIQ